MKQHTRFRHESLQDNDSIRDFLKAISSAFAKGELLLEDEDGRLQMTPEGLLRLKVTASQEDDRNRLDIRVTWQNETDIPVKKKIKVNKK